MERHLFVVNPVAGGRGQAMALIPDIKRIMTGRGLDFELLVTERAGHAAEEAAKRVSGGGEWRVYALGGDGTLNEVVNACAGRPNAVCTHIPCGTGNDFIRIFDGDIARFSSLEDLLDGSVIAIDELRTSLGSCVNVFSMGFDAQAALGMSKFRFWGRFGSQVPYNIGILLALLRGRHKRYDGFIDGRPFSGVYTLVAAMNGRYYGGGINPMPEAVPDDGEVDLIFVKKVPILRFAGALALYMKGKHSQIEYCETLRAKKLVLECRTPIAANLDGEIVKAKRVELEVRPGGVRFLVPKGVSLGLENASKHEKN